MTKTFRLKPADVKERKWFLFDASGKTLGRFAQEVAKVLRGKHKKDFTPEVDSGDGVIVINAEKIKVTGNKRARKTYFKHTGYVGTLKEISFADKQKKNPASIITLAVAGMMPIHSARTDNQLKRLRVFIGSDHTMAAQNPIPVNL